MTAIVEHWYDGTEDDLRRSNYTYSVESEEARYEAVDVPCPMCGGDLRRVVNAAVLDVRRVVRVLGQSDSQGRPLFLGERFQPNAYDLLGCRTCRRGFTVPRMSHPVEDQTR